MSSGRCLNMKASLLATANRTSLFTLMASVQASAVGSAAAAATPATPSTSMVRRRTTASVTKEEN